MSKKKVSGKSKRQSTNIAAEVTHLIRIARQHFERILLHLIKSKLAKKLDILRMLPFFKHLKPFQIIPLAHCIEPLEFKMG